MATMQNQPPIGLLAIVRATTRSFPLFKLPLELRNKIYGYVLCPETPITIRYAHHEDCDEVHFLDCGTALANKRDCKNCRNFSFYKSPWSDWNEKPPRFLSTTLLKASRTLRVEALPVMLGSNWIHFTSEYVLCKFAQSLQFKDHVSLIRQLSMHIDTDGNELSADQANIILDIIDHVPAIEQLAIDATIAISRDIDPWCLIYGLFFRLHLLSQLSLKKVYVWIRVSSRGYHDATEAVLKPKMRALERDAVKILMSADGELEMAESREAKARIDEVEEERAADASSDEGDESGEDERSDGGSSDEDEMSESENQIENESEGDGVGAEEDVDED